MPAPSCTTNSLPANASTIVTSTTATLTWNAAANASSYDVYIWTGATAPSSPTANVVGSTSYNVSGLSAVTLYRWYVVPKNGSGSATGCSSNATTFTTAELLAACVANTLPATGSTLVTQKSARLTWAASTRATSYDVYLAAGNAVPAVLVANTTELTYYATGLTANTLYSWYVAPRNANGANTACGSANRTTFTTAVATTGANLPPVANAGSNITITLPVSTVTLDATASYDPDGSIAEFFWFKGQGEPAASVIGNVFSTTPTITGLTTAGTYIYVLQIKDNNGATGYSQITVTVNAAGALGETANERISVNINTVQSPIIKALASSKNTMPPFVAAVSPNPVVSGQMATLKVTTDKASNAVMNILSSTGKLVNTQKLILVPGLNISTINTARLSQGLYIVNIVREGTQAINIKLLVE